MSPARSEGVTVDSLPDGTAVAIKRFRGEDAGAAVEREAEVLRIAVHTGVPRLIDARVDATPPCLVMELVGTRSLASSPPRTLDGLCTVLTGLCRIVADLHERGVGHGQLELDHVVLHTDSTPALCGFGAATLDAGPADRAADVAALGTLMRQVLPDHLRIEGAPRRGRLAATRGAYRERSLLNLADQAILDDVSARPSARVLADAVETVTTPRRPRRKGPTLIGACVASAAIVLATLSRPAGPQPESESLPGSTIPLPQTGAEEQVTPVATTGGAPRLAHGGVSYSAGVPGDTLITDFGCDGTTSAVMLRAHDHTLWHFVDWARAGASETAVFIDRAIESIEVTPVDDRCDAVLATDLDGRERWVGLRDGGP